MLWYNFSMTDKEKHPGGRPTKYTDDMPQSLIDFFDKPPYYEREVPHRGKDGSEYFTFEETPNDIPWFVDWCTQVGISQETMNQWAKDPNKPKFSEAYKIAKELQK